MSDSAREAFKTYDAFAKTIETETSVVDRLKHTFDFMRSCLSTGIGNRRADFWQAKQLCLALFKTPMEPAFRYPLWQQFTEILDSADLASRVISESSTFYLEQFSLALDELEKQADHEAILCSSTFSMTEKLGFDGTQSSLEVFVQGLREELSTLQGRLEHYRKFAMRYRCCREEIIDCEMNPSDKRFLFERLKQVREKIFPARAELTEKIDKLFDEEVNQFISGAIAAGEPCRPIYILKQELKVLQKIARELSLSSEGFKQARLKLTEFWDLLTALEEMHKTKIREQRAQSKLSAAEVQVRIEELRLEVSSLSYEELVSKIKQVIRFMHGQFLLREDKKQLRTELEALKEPFFAEKKRDEEKREKERSEESRAFDKLIGAVEALDVTSDDYDEKRADIEMKAGRLFLLKEQLQIFQETLSRIDARRGESVVEELERKGDLEGLAKHRSLEANRRKERLNQLKKKQRLPGLSIEQALAIEEEIGQLQKLLESHQTIDPSRS